MLKYGFVLCILLLNSILEAQDHENIKGLWKGRLTQYEGGYQELYDFEIYFTQTDSVITGYTYLKAKGVLGVIKFIGCYQGNTLHLEEKEVVISQKPEALSWCFKKINLSINTIGTRQILKGYWEADSKYGSCIPGEVAVEKVKPRA